MRIIALWVGKLVLVSLRLMHRRGAALPGLVVERLFPSFLAKTLDMLPEGVVIITGTNGKTTSTKMLSYILEPEKKVLTNATGSNFVRGIVASLIQHSRWSGALPYDIAVIELDEAYAAQFVKLYKPRSTVVLNVMRDQMDRFGEIDHTARLITKVVKKTTDFVILNRDDPRVAGMAKHTAIKVEYFGVASKLRGIYKNDDELHQSSAQKTFSTSGAMVELQSIADDGDIVIKANSQELAFKPAASGTYNAQNVLAVFAAALVLGYDAGNIVEKLQKVKPAFGRGEKIKIGSKTAILQLVKNPGGFRHALLSGAQKKHNLTVIAINDDYADGRDVSWLWDVGYEDNNGLQGDIVTSGVRAMDMALRLKYDSVVTTLIEPDMKQCLAYSINAIDDGQTILIYATYTAMLEIRKLLSGITEVDKV